MFGLRQWVWKRSLFLFECCGKRIRLHICDLQHKQNPWAKSNRTPLWKPALSTAAISSPSLSAFTVRSVNGYFLKEVEQLCEGEKLHGQC